MAMTHAQDRREPINPWWLLFSLFGGTTAWTVHLIGSYATANYFCGDAFATWVLHALALVTGAVAVVAVYAAVTTLRRMNDIPARERSLEEQRTQFLMSGGILLGLLGLMAIFFGELAVLLAGCSS